MNRSRQALGLAGALIVFSAARANAITADELVGIWAGETSRGGETTPLAFHLSAAESGALNVKLTVPVVHFFESALGAVPPRIERIGNQLNLFDGDVRRREGIETAQNSESLKFFIDEKISHLADGMNPGIGATGTDDSRRRPKKSRNRTFEHFLDGFTIRLNLPTAITRAVVLN